MPNNKTKRLFNPLDATDLIAVIVIIGSFILIGLHIDTYVGIVLTSVVAFYFGSKKANGGL